MRKKSKTKSFFTFCTVSLCVSFNIFLSSRFYVKSISENLEVLKPQFFAILGALNFVNFVISGFKKSKNSWKSKFRAFKCLKMADLALQVSPKLISRKIRMIAKSLHFYTVFCHSDFLSSNQQKLTTLNVAQSQPTEKKQQ